MIICCGEALIDMLPRRSTLDEPAFSPYSGGAVFNTAIALGRLGTPVEFFCGLSSDLFGEQLRETLAASGAGSRRDRYRLCRAIRSGNARSRHCNECEGRSLRRLPRVRGGTRRSGVR